MIFKMIEHTFLSEEYARYSITIAALTDDLND